MFISANKFALLPLLTLPTGYISEGYSDIVVQWNADIDVSTSCSML
jgi:hypothetical protein